MRKLLIFAIILLGCSSNKKNTTESWRPFFLSDKEMKNGLVKVFKVSKPNGAIYYYDQVKLKDNKIQLTRFDEDFNIVRIDINNVDVNGIEIARQSYLIEKVGKVDVEIIKPRKLFYQPTNEVEVVISEISKCSPIETQTYQGKEIKCLRINYNQIFHYMDKTNKNQFKRIWIIRTRHRTLLYGIF